MKIVMTNYFNTQYYASIFIVTPRQELIVIYDTGSDWLTIESKHGAHCLNTAVDDRKSSTGIPHGTKVEEKLYGSAELYGYDVKDNVYLDKAGGTFASTFEFFEIH